AAAQEQAGAHLLRHASGDLPAQGGGVRERPGAVPRELAAIPAAPAAAGFRLSGSADPTEVQGAHARRSVGNVTTPPLQHLPHICGKEYVSNLLDVSRTAGTLPESASSYGGQRRPDAGGNRSASPAHSFQRQVTPGPERKEVICE